MKTDVNENWCKMGNFLHSYGKLKFSGCVADTALKSMPTHAVWCAQSNSIEMLPRNWV